MILKLPIIEDNKIIFSIFRLEKKKDYLILSSIENKNQFKNFILNETFVLSDSISDINSDLKNLETCDNISLLKVATCNQTFGINFISIYLPLKLYIFDKFIWTHYFLNISLISNFSNNNIDFFCCLNKKIVEKFKLSFLSFNNLKKNITKIWKLSTTQFNNMIVNKIYYNLDQYNKYFWEIVNLQINMALFLIYLFPSYTNKTIKEYQQTNSIPKRIIIVANNLKNIKFKVNSSNEYNISEHLLKLENKELKLENLEINKTFFLKINIDKYISVYIIKIENKLIICDNFKINFDKYKWYYYPPNIIIKPSYILILFLYNKEIFYESFNKFNNRIEKKYYNNILSYFIDNQLISNLLFFIDKNINNIESSYFEVLKSNSYDYVFFKDMVNTYTEIDQIVKILKILCNNYTYPIKFNKNELDNNFDDILYISLYHYNKILTCIDNKIILLPEISQLIPYKVKSLYLNIIKIFYKLLKLPNEPINNFKFFHDVIYKNFIKIFFYEDSKTILLFKTMINDNEIINNIKFSIQNNFNLIDILNKITWNNINKKLPYLNIIINNKFIFFHKKLNKNIFPENYDNRIKNIILNPFEMLHNLKNEDEFISWFKFINFKIDELYFNTIIIDDINILYKLCFLLLNIKEQDLKEPTYIYFLDFARKYITLLLYNNRVNLKIKEFLNLKIPFNLGILTKHLIQPTTDQLSNNQIIPNQLSNNQIDILKSQLIILNKKYIKYKKKYISIKDSIK